LLSGHPTILYLPPLWQWDDNYKVEMEGCKFADGMYQAKCIAPSMCNKVHLLRPVGSNGHRGWDGGYG
jgi:hypothetical protein